MIKPHVGILFGGKSAEHEISLLSSKSIYDAIDKSKYDVSLIGIAKDGRWFLGEEANNSLALLPYRQEHNVIGINGNDCTHKLDVIFPVLHGPLGEDGTIQGLLKLADIPFVGAGTMGSAVAMDKDVMKRLIRDAGLPTAKFITLQQADKNKIDFETVNALLGMPVFIKPANMGSSVGISKVTTEKEFNQAVASAFEFDRKIIIEEHINGREIECSVLGNDEPIASIPGEIIPHHEFYSYEAKYLDDNGASLVIPADIPDKSVADIQELAIKSFQVLGCEGMGRVDFFLTDAGDVYFNEINTIPGFTSISMYPKLWEASGIAYPELIDRLIQLAIDRYEQESKLETTYDFHPKA